MAYSRLLAPFRQPSAWLFLVASLPGAALAQDAKPPYSVIYGDFGGDVLSHRSSSASTPTQSCPDESVTVGTKACAERFSSAGNFSMAMGVRPIRYLQVDALDVAVVGNYNNWQSRTSTFTCVSGCGSGNTVTTRTIGGSSSFVTTGARGVLPLAHERILLSGGGGFAWLWTNERAQSGANEQVQCASCTSVGGHGPTFIGEIMYMTTRHIGVGFHVRYVNISSSGLTQAGSYSNVFYGTKYKDSFLMTGAEVSIRWATRHK